MWTTSSFVSTSCPAAWSRNPLGFNTFTIPSLCSVALAVHQSSPEPGTSSARGSDDTKPALGFGITCSHPWHTCRAGISYAPVRGRQSFFTNTASHYYVLTINNEPQPSRPLARPRRSTSARCAVSGQTFWQLCVSPPTFSADVARSRLQ